MIVGTPTWPNHPQICADLGLTTRTTASPAAIIRITIMRMTTITRAYSIHGIGRTTRLSIGSARVRP